jgi:hypothetical protein
VQLLEADCDIEIIKFGTETVDGCEQGLSRHRTVLRGPNPPLLRLKPKILKIIVLVKCCLRICLARRKKETFSVMPATAEMFAGLQR